MKKTKVRFPNESYYDDVFNFKWEDFRVNKIFSEEVFGWWGDIYVAIPRFEYDLMKKEKI
tara:strand:+ start:179 stop:358 length:180 start_codon:yes stop_codon:yes gene_type:complete